MNLYGRVHSYFPPILGFKSQSVGQKQKVELFSLVLRVIIIVIMFPINAFQGYH